jgi:hypothetical protein
MASRYYGIVILLAGLNACARSTPPERPAPVLAALQCAQGVVEHYGFLTLEGTDFFPWRLPPRGQSAFTAQRGDSLARETVSVSVVTVPATGAVKVQARGSGSWINAGQPIRSTSYAADFVARLVQGECSVPEPAA